MNFPGFLAFFKALSMPGMLPVMHDIQATVRMNFLFAALESGLLQALEQPTSGKDLAKALKVERPELLEVLLDLNVSLKELSESGGTFTLRGKRARALATAKSDSLAAMVQAYTTYYNSVYRHFAQRLQGAPSGNYLEEIGPLVARFSKIGEHFIRYFIRQTLQGHEQCRILEIGCGSGAYLNIAAQIKPLATGVGLDMDPGVVDQARQNMERWGIADRFQILQGDIADNPEGLSGPFDLVTLYNMIYYFAEPDRPALFNAIKKRLADRGTLALVSNMQSQGVDPMAANLDLAVRSIKGCHPLPKLKKIQEQLKACGFSEIKPVRLMPKSTFYVITAIKK